MLWFRWTSYYNGCNLILGRIQPSNFPNIFGKSGKDEIDIIASERALKKLLKKFTKRLKVKLVFIN